MVISISEFSSTLSLHSVPYNIIGKHVRNAIMILIEILMLCSMVKVSSAQLTVLHLFHQYCNSMKGKLA